MLSPKQRRVARQLLTSQLTEEQILQKYKISYPTYRQWLASDEFQAELRRLLQYARLRTEYNLALYAPAAALALARLLGEENLDLSRKAAIDIIDRCLKLTAPPSKPGPANNEPDQPDNLSDDQAVQTLLHLADKLKSP